MFVCKTVRTRSRLFTQAFVSLKWFASVCKTARVCNLTWICVQTLFSFSLRLLFSGTCWFLLWWLTVRKSGNWIMSFPDKQHSLAKIFFSLSQTPMSFTLHYLHCSVSFRVNVLMSLVKVQNLLSFTHIMVD